MKDKKIISTKVINNVKIITFDDGSQNFVNIDDNTTQQYTPKGFWQKIKNWWNNIDVKPYVKIRDLSDPIGKVKEDPSYDGSCSKKAAEIGIKITF